MTIRPICALASPKANGRPVTNRDYFNQGRAAAAAGFKLDDCPYYATSTAETQWKRGFAAPVPASLI